MAIFTIKTRISIRLLKKAERGIMRLFKPKQIELTDDDKNLLETLRYLKEHTLMLDSLFLQNRIKQSDYEKELKLIDNSLIELEGKYNVL